MTNMVKLGLRVQLEARVELIQYYFSTHSLSLSLSKKKILSVLYIYIQSSSLA